MLPLKNYYFSPDYDGWQKFNGGTVPDGYELRNFVHCGLMIKKIPPTKKEIEKQEHEQYLVLKAKYENS